MLKKPKGKYIVIEETEIVKPTKAKGGKWIQKMHMKKGALHQDLHVPIGQKIPTAKLRKATHSIKPIVRERANLDMTLRKFSPRNG